MLCLQWEAPLQTSQVSPKHNHTKHQLSSPRHSFGPDSLAFNPTALAETKVSSPKVSPAHVRYEVLFHLSPSPHPTHPHKPKIFHSLCCHGKGVLEAILLLGGGGGGGCCCCCCHGGRGPEGGGGGCPLGGGGGGGIMPIGGGGIIPSGKQRIGIRLLRMGDPGKCSH